MAKRGNPFTSDAPAPRKAFDKGEAKRNAAVTVSAHSRRHPVKNPHRAKLQPGGPRADVHEADNTFRGAERVGPGSAVIGLAGEPAVNHLRAAIGLMNRRKA